MLKNESMEMYLETILQLYKQSAPRKERGAVDTLNKTKGDNF